MKICLDAFQRFATDGRCSRRSSGWAGLGRTMTLARRPIAAALVCASLIGSPHSGWAAPVIAERDFGDLSIEELMNVSVTSVSKREQKLTAAAAAVAVLTNDDTSGCEIFGLNHDRPKTHSIRFPTPMLSRVFRPRPTKNPIPAAS